LWHPSNVAGGGTFIVGSGVRGNSGSSSSGDTDNAPDDGCGQIMILQGRLT